MFADKEEEEEGDEIVKYVIVFWWAFMICIYEAIFADV